MAASAGATPAQVGLEYTRGTGAFFPGFTTQAVVTGVQQAVQTVNGTPAGGITLKPGPGSGGIIRIIPTPGSPGDLQIGVTVSPPVVGIGAAYPATPYAGEQFYNTTLNHLYVWSGSAWLQA
jgi:hypothetical protein